MYLPYTSSVAIRERLKTQSRDLPVPGLSVLSTDLPLRLPFVLPTAYCDLTGSATVVAVERLI